MSYYDNVKDSVKDEKEKAKSASDGGGGGGPGNFSTLREEAEKNADNQEEDDTPIEVLEEGGLQKDSSSSGSDSSGSNPMTQSSQNSSKDVSEGSGSMNSSNIEEKLDKIIEQNARMIEVLESFGN
ncbi:hypothetical protein GKQ38_00945 [Candidatus Nanohaloarchaea archaeon]|nr:hypothetical protein GKQ38_00945 [Candidatus Nanohaloarchaea archaeon]